MLRASNFPSPTATWMRENLLNKSCFFFLLIFLASILRSSLTPLYYHDQAAHENENTETQLSAELEQPLHFLFFTFMCVRQGEKARESY